MNMPRQGTSGTLQGSCNIGPMENIKQSLSGHILGNSMYPGRSNTVYSVNNAQMNGGSNSSIPVGEAEAGNLDNPTIPVHDFEDNLRY